MVISWGGVRGWHGNFQNVSGKFVLWGIEPRASRECEANTLPTELLCLQSWKEHTGKTERQNRTHTKKKNLENWKKGETERMGEGQSWEGQSHSYQHPTSLPRYTPDTARAFACFLLNRKCNQPELCLLLVKPSILKTRRTLQMNSHSRPQPQTSEGALVACNVHEWGTLPEMKSSYFRECHHMLLASVT